MKQDFKFLQKISKSLKAPKIEKRKDKKVEKHIEMEETAAVRNATNDILDFLKSRDDFWRNVEKWKMYHTTTYDNEIPNKNVKYNKAEAMYTVLDNVCENNYSHIIVHENNCSHIVRKTQCLNNYFLHTV